MQDNDTLGFFETLQGAWWVFFYRRCLVGFPWFRPRRPLGLPPMIAARRLARVQYAKNHGVFYRILARVLATVTWPLAVVVHLVEIRFARGPELIPVRRFPGAFWAALRHNVVPGEYFAYELWQRGRMRDVDNYLYSKEAARLFTYINAKRDLNPLDDKLKFYDMCVAHAIPSPTVLAAFSETGSLIDFHGGEPPKRDLFVKSRASLGGRRAECLRWRGEFFESDRGFRLRPKELSFYLLARARKEATTFLVQPMLSNDVDLKSDDWMNLATARLVTGIMPSRAVIPIFAYFSFVARTDGPVAKGLRVALIDIKSGRLLSRPQDLSKRCQIADEVAVGDIFTLPAWGLALRHAQSAHKVCPGFIFIGWDIAFTDEGPIVLEGNLNWSADIYQRLSGTPLGRTHFPEILSARLRQMGIHAPPAE